jgi:heme-degrading monooxygenase HmoA
MDVWESEQEFRTFQQERLMPAMQQVASENGMDLGDQPEHRVVKVHDFVRGN